jgi:transglutaminase-like putative cysteine protease
LLLSANETAEFTRPTYFLDFEHPAVRSWLEEHLPASSRGIEAAVRLYYLVRDGWKYNPYRVSREAEKTRASHVITQGFGYCTTKALLLAALARAAGVPSRLGFGDVRNHLASPRLIEYLQSELFAWHGFTELYLEGKWVRCTPAFDAGLCRKFGVDPLEFNGQQDSVFHAFDQEGRVFMEYVRYRGVHSDLPFEEMFTSLGEIYPHLFPTKAHTS